MTTRSLPLSAAMIAACCALSATYADAGSIDIVGVLSDESASYDAQTLVSQATVEAPAPLGSFTHSFSQLGETAWTVTWEAPQGKAFEIEVPTAFDSSIVEVGFNFGGGVFGPAFNAFGGDVLVNFDSLPGSPALPIGSEVMSLTGPGGTGGGARAQADTMPPGEVYRFTSVTFACTVPADYDVDLDSTVVRFLINGSAFSLAADPPPADPGQWVRLIDVPSPCPGDVDGDSDTDVFDFADLAANFGAGPGATREMGDLTGDGFVDVFDFADLAADFGCESP